MANQGLVDLLKQGVTDWNVWKAKNPAAEIDLSEADFSGANLQGANLRKVNLRGANLQGANLSKAGLRDSILTEADLSQTQLTEADLHGANVSHAQFANSVGLTETAINDLKALGALFEASVIENKFETAPHPPLRSNIPLDHSIDTSDPEITDTSAVPSAGDPAKLAAMDRLIEKPIIERQAPMKLKDSPTRTPTNPASVNPVQAFNTKIAISPDLQTQLRSITSIGELRALAQSQGFDLTQTDLQEMAQQAFREWLSSLSPNMRPFFEHMHADTTLTKKYTQCRTPADVIALATADGFELTAGDLRSAAEAAATLKGFSFEKLWFQGLGIL